MPSNLSEGSPVKLVQVTHYTFSEHVCLPGVVFAPPLIFKASQIGGFFMAKSRVLLHIYREEDHGEFAFSKAHHLHF